MVFTGILKSFEWK